MNFRQWTDEILQARKDRSMTHKELSAALGYSEKYLYNVLEGKSRSQKAVHRISNYLAVPSYIYPTFDTCQRYAIDCVKLGDDVLNLTKVLAFIGIMVTNRESFTTSWEQISGSAYVCFITIIDPSKDYSDDFDDLYRRGA